MVVVAVAVSVVILLHPITPTKQLAMAAAQISSSLFHSHRDVSAVKSNQGCVLLPRVSIYNIASSAGSFTGGSSLLVLRASSRRNPECKAKSLSIRCEQNTKDGGSGLDVWLGRFAMVGFAIAITVEVTTGKGLLGNFGLTSPLPTVALGVTAVIGVLTAVFIFQSASTD